MSDIALALAACFAPVLLILGGIAAADYFDWGERWLAKGDDDAHDL